MYGRSGFWIHGGTESHGCIILTLKERMMLEGLSIDSLVVHQ